jgi:hypothetical protein
MPVLSARIRPRAETSALRQYGQTRSRVSRGNGLESDGVDEVLTQQL